MVGVKDVSQQDFVMAFAAYLKKTGTLNVPEWIDIVKTATFKELSPYNRDWYYVRCASTLRHMFIRKGAGVKSFMKVYGGRKRRGTKPSHFAPGSKHLARSVLQSLQSAGLIQENANNPTGARVVSSEGVKHMNRIATQLVTAKRQ